MARNSSPRKKYKPKPNDSVLIRFSEEDERRFQLAPHVQLCHLMEGRGDDEAWDTLELRVRWCEHLGKKLEQHEVVAHAAVSVESMTQIHKLFTEEGRYQLTSEQGSILGECLSLADELQVLSTRRELRDSLNAALAIIRKAPLAGRRNSFVF